MFSDGLVESHVGDGEQFGYDRVVHGLLPDSEGNISLDSLKVGLVDFMQGASHHDDVSVALISCSSGARPVRASASQGGAEKRRIDFDAPVTVDWRFNMVLGPNELRNCSVVPFVMEFVKQIDFLSNVQSEVFLILSEMFNNALDHGVLEVSSSLKDVRVGMDEYLRQRIERLENLKSGEVELDLSLVEVHGRKGLRVRMRDSGKGFDHSGKLEAGEDNTQTHGRGIRLLRNLAESIQFVGKGNEVILYFMPPQ